MILAGFIFLAVVCLVLWMLYRSYTSFMPIEQHREPQEAPLPQFRTLKEFFEHTDDEGQV